MSRRRALAVAAPVVALALALPAAALAKPNRYSIETSVAPGERAVLDVGKFPRTGEFSFRLRVSSDADKRFRLTQRRVGGSPFTVIDATGASIPAPCQGAAGSVICTQITTPETPANSRWRFALANTGADGFRIELVVTWRPVNGG